MEPVRILQFGMSPNPGGVESFIMNYYRNIDRDKVQFDFVKMYNQIAYEEEIESLGGKIHNISFFKNHPIRNYYDIRKLIKKQNYKIVHVNMLSAAYIIPLIAAKKSGVNYIIAHSHNSSTSPGLVRNLLNFLNKSKLQRNANHFFACSTLAGNWMFGNASKQGINIINNAIDVSQYKYDSSIRAKLKKELNLEGKFVIGHVGRFQYQKNHEFLIDIFSEVHKRDSNAFLLLVGDGELMENMKKKVNLLGISDAVKFLGKRSDVNELMNCMDIFLLPSHYEGLPVVAVEAQTSGLRCILSDVITTETNISGQVEFMSLKLSAQEWAEQILSNQFKNDRENAYKKTINAVYDIKSSAKSLEDFYLSFE
ncbi:glycosyltransferase family 1 protein [Ureibacillus chungkukjangi]|uniref:Glycosyltransferase involved in cell wall biosynthesis n=1 Tax=Ureibacillus chungkukjangi TaxID=1202712 RepID=A0A318TJF4_9BACL|nr:glycosyltransferase family 1 protein [Ureibacillus chungkukjangi]PYF03258.1 glycosyltransferase involved in cell wall biosynthesis [Ureibacillus chungkukjangi]